MNDLTTGSIYRKLLLFSFPIFLGQIFQQLYNTIDSLIVGRYLGDQALAAVSSSGSMIFFFFFLCQGGALGTGVFIS